MILWSFTLTLILTSIIWIRISIFLLWLIQFYYVFFSLFFWVAATFLLAPFNFHLYYFYFISIFNYPVYHSQPIQCILLLCFLWPTCCVISTMNVFFLPFRGRTFYMSVYIWERVYMRAYVCVWWKWESGGFRNKRSLT